MKQRSTVAEPRIAVLIPCRNEEVAIAGVVRGFKHFLPTAEIYVYDNDSTDRTKEIAAAEGATVGFEPRQGKGNVVRRMLSEIEADVYVITDGDGTYDPSSAPTMVRALMEERLAMVVGRRVAAARESYSRSRVLGNRLFTHAVGAAFGHTFTDVLSGYRVFSRGFVKSFSAASSGFEIETEMTVHALCLDLPVREIDTVYGTRVEGSRSKLHPYRDGWRIMMAILRLFRSERPLAFYSLIGSALLLLAIVCGGPSVVASLRKGLVPRLSAVIIACGIAITALTSFARGAILDPVARRRREAKMVAYRAAHQPSTEAAGEGESDDGATLAGES